ncbi:hypothetical protein SEPCBS57363_000085 [Sporothrix epigloea]|uniref:CN hydrolase domain-containing protein n=1 Tax=Sporothrix epigloea TaxID=1892477 RepID=A0ABP0D4G0_9PEZI
MTKIRLGTCSPAADESLPSSLLVLEKLAVQAASKCVDLLLLPEAFLGEGYPRSVSYSDLENTADRQALFTYYFQRAVNFGDIVGDVGTGGGTAWINKDGDLYGRPDEEVVGDGTRETLERIARQTGVFLVVGAIEKAASNLYCAMVYVCPKKGVIGKRRKVQPAGNKQLMWSPVGPASLRVISTDIKGVHINLAAAICWENYLPLLRQSLYSQNINLYLATTTHGSDAWLSLARTIGIEGRCFVLTSNLNKKAPGSTLLSDNVASATPGPTPQAQSAPTTGGVVSGTDDSGITTKVVDCAASCAGGKPRRRKKSFVLDDYGNEIILSCETVVEEDNEVASGNANGTLGAASDAPVPLPPFPRLPIDQAWEQHKHERRRSSVFDEDDNEIVLCCPRDSKGAASHHSLGDQISEKNPSKDPISLENAQGGSSWGKKWQTILPDTQLPDTLCGPAIISPCGDVLAGPQYDAGGIIVTDVDFEDCIRKRLDLGTSGDFAQ